MAIKLCHHIKEDGILCRSAALHGRHYCFFHLTYRARRVRIAQHRRRNQPLRLELPPLEDLNSVQVAIMLVMDAIIDGRLQRHEAGHLLYGLQTAGNFLRGKERVCFEVSPSAENRCVAYDSLEEDLELEDDEVSPADDSAATTAASAAGAEVATDTTATADPGGEPIVEKRDPASESGEAKAPSPVIIDKLMAVADDAPGDSPPDADPVLLDEPAPKKQPRGLRAPNAVRQSPEEAAALAKEQQGSAPECGRRDDGQIVPCTTCEVHLFKRLAQFWEGRNHPDDWLPFSGTIDCLDCQLKHLTTLGRHLDEQMPLAFHLYMILKRDGGEDPGTFDEYFSKSEECLEQTGDIPRDWRERLRRYKERQGTPFEYEADEEETEASA